MEIIERHSETGYLRIVRVRETLEPDNVIQCHYCGKFESQNWARHCKAKHGGHRKKAEDHGGVRRYPWQMNRPSRLVPGALNYGKLDPLPARQEYRAMIERVKVQLRALRKVPFYLREFGAIAMAEMYADQDPVYAAIYRGARMKDATDSDIEELNKVLD